MVAERLKIIVGQDRLLEIGTGTGVIATICAKNGADVVATDLNSQAALCTRINAEGNSVKIDVREGNMYDPIRLEEKFDFIFWSHPFNNWKVPVDDILLRSGMDYHYEGLREYIAGAAMHLTSRGRLLLGTGDSADVKMIKSIAEANGYKPQVIDEAEVPFEEGGRLTVKNMLCEFVPSPK